MDTSFKITFKGQLFDDMDVILEKLSVGAAKLRADVPAAIRDGAYTRAPKRTGEMADSIEDDDGMVVVQKYYGIFVNYGTRYMAAQPFFSMACANEGVRTMQQSLTSMIGHGSVNGTTIVSDASTFMDGQAARRGNTKATVRRSTSTRAKRAAHLDRRINRMRRQP
jgi:hypothetical protein